jgi:hypothetical protein
VWLRFRQEFPYALKYRDKIKFRSFAALTPQTNACGAPSLLRSG